MRANAMHNCTNPYQTGTEKILCVCSAGLLRSPTLAGELYKRGFNTRAAGVHDYALGEATEYELKGLMAAGLVLFLVTLLVNFMATVIVNRSRKIA